VRMRVFGVVVVECRYFIVVFFSAQMLPTHHGVQLGEALVHQGYIYVIPQKIVLQGRSEWRSIIHPVIKSNTIFQG